MANAATYTVTKTADTKDGSCNADCSLREAIDAANGGGAGPHTINIPAGTYTISGAGDDTNTAGDFDINVEINFIGAGSTSTILDGNLADRIFHVRLAGIPTSVTGMKFIQGRAGASTGGGINSLSGNITVTDSIFDDCDGSQGGALYTNSASTITISGSTVTNSNGTGAGGAINGGSISITSSTFTSNATTGGHGGAIYASGASGSVTITGTSSFSSNSTSGYGGAIYASNTASITGATFNLNHADTASQRGGAVHVSGLGQFTNCTVTNNTTAGQGGGINGGAAIEITNSTISGNTATSGVGGGVYSQTTLTISATTTINGNTAGTSGGGAYANGAATISGTTISSNTATSGAGGGIYTASTLTINPSTTIDGNTAGGSAGGGGAYANGAATVNGATITNNTNNTTSGTVRGGGIYVAGNSTFTNSTISNNTIAAGQGGGIGTNSFTLNISNSTISGNRSNTNSGGGAFGLGAMTITDSTFSGNSAGGGNGGAIWTYGFSITRSTFTSNSSTTTGGAIYVQNASGNFYGANTFTGNHADGSGGNAGGCLYSNGQAITINDAGSVFSGNYGGGSGGCLWTSSTLNINAATTFDGNYTTAAGGGGAIISQGGTMTNITFVNNHAPDFGGAFYPLTTYTINNSTFENNYLDSATTGGGALYLKNAVYTVTINNSTFSGNNAGGGQGGAIYTNTNAGINAYNSTFYNNTGTTTLALKAVTASKIALYNSIVAHPGSAALCSNTVRGGTSNNVDYNNSGNCVVSDAYRITTDPLLSALAYNGGATKTMELQTGSSAINAGGTGSLANDQRGVAAVSTRDIGAYEYSGTAADTVAPAPVSNLATGAVGGATVQLTWTAPGDDYSTGTATTYDVRYSTTPVNEGNWASATAATGEPSPSVAGTSESFTVTGLSVSTTYYFAIKTSDEVPNTSTISNVVSATTTAGGITVSGTLYSDEGTTAVTTGPTVRLIANGSSVGTGVANGSGVYSITASVNSGDAIIAYIDSNGGTVGNAVTVSNGANLSGLNIYADRVITRHDNSGSLTNALMSTAKGAYSDTDILFSVSGGNLAANGVSTELFVWTGHTFAPGGTITTTHMDINGTLNSAANAISVAGNWDATGGVFTSTGTVTFNATSGTLTITPGGVDADHDFQNIVFNDAAGTATFQLGGAIDMDGDFTVTDGIFDTTSNYAVTIAGTLSDSANGRFKANGSTITVGGDASLNANNDATESTDFNSATLVLNGAASNINYSNLASWWSNGFYNLTVGQGGVTDTLNNWLTVKGTLTLGTGGLTSPATTTLALTKAGDALVFNAASTLSIDTLMFLKYGGGQNLPTLTNGYSCNISIAGGSSVVVTQTGNVTLNSGKNLLITGDNNADRALSFNTGGFALTVGGNLVIGAGSDTGAKALTANGSTITVTGNFTVNSGDNTFNAGTSTVVLNGANQTITGSTTFNNLTKSVTTARTLTFAAGSTTTIGGTVTLNGASGQLLTLASSTGSSVWNFTVNSGAVKAISYVSVSWSNASGSHSSQKPVAPTNSTDGGNNTDWFSAGSYQPDSLIKLSTEGDESYLANNTYETTASAQTKSKSVLSGAIATFNIKFENDGGTTDSFIITGTGNGSGFTVQYLDDVSTDRTTDVTGAGYTISGLAAGASKVWTLNVTPGGSVAGGTSYNVFVTATSSNNSEAKDQVKGVTTSNSANLTLVKSVDKSTANPGEDLTYSVAATNGSGLTDASSIVLTDAIPTYTGFKISGASFSAGTSTLSSAIIYSNDSGSSWTYTPASEGCSAPSGYDYCVTNVKWTMTGNMPSGRNFSIGLIVRVK